MYRDYDCCNISRASVYFAKNWSRITNSFQINNISKNNVQLYIAHYQERGSLSKRLSFYSTFEIVFVCSWPPAKTLPKRYYHHFLSTSYDPSHSRRSFLKFIAIIESHIYCWLLSIQLLHRLTFLLL